MPISNIRSIDEYKKSKPLKEESPDYYDFDEMHKRFDILEDLLIPDNDILIKKVKPSSRIEHSVDIKRLSSLFVSTLVMGASICMAIISAYGLISISWQFFGAIAFASSGVALASLLILCGVDNELYE